MTLILNPPAFPCEAQGDRNVPPEHDYIQTGIYGAKFPGMTLRDYFAAQVLPIIYDKNESYAVMATVAYAMAEAMLEERVLPA